MSHKKIYNKLPVAWEGIPFILGGIALLCLFFILGWEWLAAVSALATLFTIFFFRDPERSSEPLERAVLTPADGKVLSIERLKKGDDRYQGESIKISIFMSLFNAHINRIPIGGKIIQLSYHPGKFFPANRDKASRFNEHNIATLRTDNHERLIFVQIAGRIARRIACWITKDDYVQAGQRFGLIRFGSRLEVYLPSKSTIFVNKGEKVKAGKTIIGYLDENKEKIQAKKGE